MNAADFIFEAASALFFKTLAWGFIPTLVFPNGSGHDD